MLRVLLSPAYKNAEWWNSPQKWVWKAGWSFVQSKFMMNEGSEGNNLLKETQAKEVIMNSFKAILQLSYDLMGNDSIISQRPADRSEVSDKDFTSFWWVFGFCTVLRLIDMTTRGGGGRSLTTEIRSLFWATASTLDQLIGWLLNSRGHSESGHC